MKGSPVIIRAQNFSKPHSFLGIGRELGKLFQVQQLQDDLHLASFGASPTHLNNSPNPRALYTGETSEFFQIPKLLCRREGIVLKSLGLYGRDRINRMTYKICMNV